MRHDYVQTTHLLLSLRLSEGMAADVLRDAGVSTAELRRALFACHDGPHIDDNTE